jgi:hypothetical protein
MELREGARRKWAGPGRGIMAAQEPTPQRGGGKNSMATGSAALSITLATSPGRDGRQLPQSTQKPAQRRRGEVC